MSRPCKLTFDLLTFKVVSESDVTLATSVPILVFLGFSVLDLGPMYASPRHPSKYSWYVRSCSILRCVVVDRRLTFHKHVPRFCSIVQLSPSRADRPSHQTYLFVDGVSTDIGMQPDPVQDRLRRPAASPAHSGWGQSGRRFVRGSRGRKSPAGSRGSRGWETVPQKLKHINYILILTFLIMKRCNMFVGGSGQRAI